MARALQLRPPASAPALHVLLVAAMVIAAAPAFAAAAAAADAASTNAAWTNGTHLGAIAASALLRNVNELAREGATRDGGVDRGYLAPAAAGARAKLLAWMREAGMVARVDCAGNVIGRLACAGGGAAGVGGGDARSWVVLGSHHDTVVNGGKWDGAYGVLAAIAAAGVVNERTDGVCGLPFDVEVVSFDDEEGNSAFGLTNSGAKAYVGRDVFAGDDDSAETRARRELFVDAYKSARLCNSSAIESLSASEQTRLVEESVRGAARSGGFDDVLAYFELHIEQGPVLEAADEALGVVTAIAGQKRLTLRFRGVSGHAGTVPMRLRQDALVAAAGVVAAADRVAAAAGQGAVATVGVLRQESGSAVNTIPGHVVMSLDVRAPDDEVRDSVVADILEEAERIAVERGVSFAYTTDHCAPAVKLSEWLGDVARTAIGKLKSENSVAIRREESEGDQSCASTSETSFGDSSLSKHTSDVIELPSGAGHDAQLLAGVADAVMIFVRCAGGVSHSPHEAVSDEDALYGASAVLAMLDTLASSSLKEQ